MKKILILIILIFLIFVLYNKFKEEGFDQGLKNEINSLEQDFSDLLDLGDDSDIDDMDQELDDIQEQDFDQEADDNTAFDQLESELESELDSFLSDLEELGDFESDDSLEGLDDDLDTITE